LQYAAAAAADDDDDLVQCEAISVKTVCDAAACLLYVLTSALSIYCYCNFHYINDDYVYYYPICCRHVVLSLCVLVCCHVHNIFPLIFFVNII